MKLLSSSLALFAVVSNGFSPSPALVSKVRGEPTELYISSWGSGGPSSSRRKKAEINPEIIQSYIQDPEPASVRSNLGDSVLVSGWVNRDNLGPDSDQGIFDLLNDEDHPAFAFEKIVAFVDDAAFAKKRLISRSARYSGLLNKLDFSEAKTVGALPDFDQLEGVTSWVARIENDLEQIKAIVYRVQASDVQNIALLIADASSLEVEAALELIKPLESDGKTFTVVAVGAESAETEEATHPYEVIEMTTTTGASAAAGPVLPTDATYSREESFRLVAECLGLECGSNRALAFAEVRDVNATDTKLVKGLREAGYSWSQELEHIIEGGLDKYKKACDDFKERFPDASEGLVTADEKLEQAIERAMIEQEKEKEAALARMEEKYEASLSAPEWS